MLKGDGTPDIIIYRNQICSRPKEAVNQPLNIEGRAYLVSLLVLLKVLWCLCKEQFRL